MTKLPVYLEQKIRLAQLFKPKPIKLESEAEILEMFEILDNDLSPENLCCDGELSKTATAKKFREIKAAWKFLEKKLGREVQPECGW